MADTLTAPTEAPIVAPEILDPKEASAIAAPPAPVPADDPAASIADASKALREKAAQAPVDAPPAVEQPRNPDGTFAPKDGAEGAAPEPESQPEPEAAAPEDAPKVFVLKGEAQRGEPDIELDVAGLPPEVLERLERNEKQGMRRKEYDAALVKVQKETADLDAARTEMSIDPIGTVLNYMAPAHRQQMGEVLLLEHWDALAPTIEAMWQDPAGRSQRLNDLRNGVQSRRSEVTTTVQATRAATAVRSAVSALVPDTADEGTAGDFYQTSIALLQNALSRGETITPETVPQLLAAHRRRFFADASDAAVTTPPARPKLAVKKTPAPASAAVNTSPTTVLSQDAVRAQTLARQAALATAKPGAGAGAVQRPGPGANATIEEASRFLRAQSGR